MPAIMRTFSEILVEIVKLQEACLILQQNGASTTSVKGVLSTLSSELASAASVESVTVQSVTSGITEHKPSATPESKVAFDVLKDQTASAISKERSTTSNLKAAVDVEEVQTTFAVSRGPSATSDIKAAVDIFKKDWSTSGIIKQEASTTSNPKAAVDTLKKDWSTPDIVNQEPSSTSDSKAAVNTLIKDWRTPDIVEQKQSTTSDPEATVDTLDRDQRTPSTIKEEPSTPSDPKVADDVHNQQLDREPTPNPFEVPEKQNIEAARKYVRQILPWNKEQLEVFDNAKEMIDCVMFLHGAAGTGKTAVAVALAKYYLRAGFHCLMTAPSHSTADEIVQKHLLLGNNDVRPIRVYPSAQERLDVESSENNNTSTVSIKQGPFDTEQFDITLLAAIDEMKTGILKRAFKMDNMSLEARVQEVARDGSRKLVRAYGVPEDEEPGPDVDMWEELRGFLNKMKTTSLRKWADIDRMNYGRTLKYTKRDIISDHRLIVSTTNTAVCEDIRSSFGSTALGIVIIQDGAAMEVEPNTWCPSIKLDNYNKVKGWIVVGDDLQPRPKVISARETPAYNEHAPNLTNTLFTKLRNTNFSTIVLREQTRMHQVLAEWPNTRIYRGQLRNGKATHGRLDADLAELMAKYLGITKYMEWQRADQTESSRRLHFVNVRNGTCKINAATTSRYNAENVQVVMGFIKLLWDHKIIPRLTARLITPYHDQLRLYNSEYKDLERNSHIPSAELPVLSTIDGAQGKEAQIVIFDSVVSSGERRRDLGLLMDDRRMNMVCTRAQEVFLLVGNLNVISGNMIEYWDERKGLEIGYDEVTPPNPEPYLVGLIRFLHRRNDTMYTEAGVIDTLPDVLQTPGPAIRRLGGR